MHASPNMMPADTVSAAPSHQPIARAHLDPALPPSLATHAADDDKAEASSTSGAAALAAGGRAAAMAAVAVLTAALLC